MWSLKKTHRVGELVAAVAVVFSLLFVGYEVQQNSNEQRRIATQTLAIEWSKAVTALTDSGEMACIYLRGMEDMTQLSSAEQVRFSALMLRFMRVIEEFHWQWEEGDIEPRIWNGFASALGDLANPAGFRTWWAFRKHWFSEPFQLYIDQRLAVPAPQHRALVTSADCV